jgi:hypothetical protein
MMLKLMVILVYVILDFCLRQRVDSERVEVWNFGKKVVRGEIRCALILLRSFKRAEAAERT